MQFKLSKDKEICLNCGKFDNRLSSFNEGCGICRYKRFKNRENIRVNPYQKCNER